MLGKLLQGRYYKRQVQEDLSNLLLKIPTYMVTLYLRPQTSQACQQPSSWPSKPSDGCSLRSASPGKLGNYNRIPQLLAHLKKTKQFYLVSSSQDRPWVLNCNPVIGFWHESQWFNCCKKFWVSWICSQPRADPRCQAEQFGIRRRQQDGSSYSWLTLPRSTGSLDASGKNASTDNHHFGDWLLPGTIDYWHNRLYAYWAGARDHAPNSDARCARHIGIQVLTGLNPGQLLEDHTSEVIWQH